MAFFNKSDKADESPLASATLSIDGSRAVLLMQGDWVFSNTRTSSSTIEEQLKGKGLKSLSVSAETLSNFDSSAISFLLKCYEFAKEQNIDFDMDSLPEAMSKLMLLATSVESKVDKQEEKKANLVHRLGSHAINVVGNAKGQFEFIGELVLCFFRLLRGKASFSREDFMLIIQRAGIEALPIVTLISFLIGLILAFVGGVQLAMYGSEIYTADLVGLAMVREMGVIMVGIVMAGRTGAAFAAELGTMKVNEEISAYETFGISPMEYLVMPRLIALIAMFPLLTIFADVVGIAGGALISCTLFDLNFEQYMVRTQTALTITHVMTGFGKSFIFGIIVAVIGCLRGMRCGSSSASVGLATTASVVTSITMIIVADAVFAVIFNIFGI